MLGDSLEWTVQHEHEQFTSLIYLFLHLLHYLSLPFALLPSLFSHGIYFTQNPNNLSQIQKTILADPSSPSQPSQTPAGDPSQDSDDEAAAQTNEAPPWDDEVTPAVEPYEPPSWHEQDSVSAQSGWVSETAEAGLAQPDWEDRGVECWGEEGSQVGQEQDVDTNWGSGAAQAWEAESKPPQWEELQSVRGARVWINCVVLGWPRSK